MREVRNRNKSPVGYFLDMGLLWGFRPPPPFALLKVHSPSLLIHYHHPMFHFLHNNKLPIWQRINIGGQKRNFNGQWAKEDSGMTTQPTKGVPRGRTIGPTIRVCNPPPKLANANSIIRLPFPIHPLLLPSPLFSTFISRKGHPNLSKSDYPAGLSFILLRSPRPRFDDPSALSPLSVSKFTI